MGRAPSSPILLKRKKRRRRSNVWGRFVFVFFLGRHPPKSYKDKKKQEEEEIFILLFPDSLVAPQRKTWRDDWGRRGHLTSRLSIWPSLSLSLLSLFLSLSVFEFQTETEKKEREEKILWRVEGNSFGAPLLFSCTSCFPGDRRAASHNQSAPVLFVFFSSSLGDCEGR